MLRDPRKQPHQATLPHKLLARPNRRVPLYVSGASFLIDNNQVESMLHRVRSNRVDVAINRRRFSKTAIICD